MKINKKECRKFADPGTKMQLSSGLLHAEQIKYVIRTAVRIIDRHKILILYIHTREKAAQGDFKPCMTMFHCQDDFMTLEHRDDDSTVWRTSAFNHLDKNWSLSSKSAFYSPKDEQRVRKYFKSGESGFKALTSAQDAILEHRRLKRQRTRENRILDRMARHSGPAARLKRLDTPLCHAWLLLLRLQTRCKGRSGCLFCVRQRGYAVWRKTGSKADVPAL